MTFEELRVINLARCVEDFKHSLESWSVAEWTNAMCGEAGEAANIAKKLIRIRNNMPGNNPEDFDVSLKLALGKELADVVIYADLVATSLGLELEDCIKLKFNQTSDKLGSNKKL